jgi:tetratricopeptide (TPR) repeat protein
LRRIAELRTAKEEVNLAYYLLGREPAWRDITDGFAVIRDFEEGITEQESFLEPMATLLTGTAGTGKSTTLMRMALELQATGKDVVWLDTETDLSIARIRQLVREAQPDVVAIDDVDLFQHQAGPLIVELVRDNPSLRVLAASRSTRAERYRIAEALLEIDSRTLVVPPLSDSDIDLLLDALASAGVLGRLKGMSRAEQRQALREHAGRQLLVAMIEATSGRRFEEKIAEECGQLLAGQSRIYVIVAVATRFRTWLTRDELLLALGESTVERLNDLEALVRQYLVVERGRGRYWLRHRMVAERAVAWYRTNKQLAGAVEGLLFAFATRRAPGMSRRSREWQLIRSLLNHKFMIEEVADLPAIRGIYERLVPLLDDDFHFWLQRGSLEVEVGDIELAENFLNQARGLAPDDYRVQTEWAYMSLKRASADATSGAPGWRERAEEAFTDLNEAIEARGRTDSYPFHVLGSQGLRYVRRAPMTRSDKEVVLAGLRTQMREAVRLHPAAQDLRQLHDDIDREYLMLAVEGG